MPEGGFFDSLKKAFKKKKTKVDADSNTYTGVDYGQLAKGLGGQGKAGREAFAALEDNDKQ